MILPTSNVITSPPSPAPIVLRLIASGDQRYCREVIDAWEPTIVVIAARHLCRASDLDDLVQVGRIAVYHCALNFDASLGVPFANYAKRSIKNLVVKESQRLARQRSFDGSSQAVEEHGASLDKISDCRQQLEPVTDWTRQLPEPHATIFRLLYVENLTQRSAARRMGISQPRVAQLHKSFLSLAWEAFVN